MIQTTIDLVEGLRRYCKKQSPAKALEEETLQVAPTPASRPKVGRWGVYYGKNYKRFRDVVTPIVEAIERTPTEAPLIVIIECAIAKPKTSKYPYPVKGDVDNFAKGPLDSLNEKLWKDDKQIIGLSIFKRYTRPGEEPHVRVNWFEYTGEED